MPNDRRLLKLKSIGRKEEATLYVSCECPVDRFDMVECIVHLTFESEFDLKSKLFGSIGTKLLMIISYTHRSN